MEDLPQRSLRNNVSAVLRAAEAGQRYTITVDGRPVAELGPHRPRQWLPRAQVDELLTTPTDEALLDDVGRAGLDEGLGDDPWAL